MKINFYNENVRGARLEIQWGKNHKTPAFDLKAGAIAVLDMDYTYDIPDGAECRVFAWQPTTGHSVLSAKVFRHFNSPGAAGAFKICLTGLGIALEYCTRL